jgi:hypothetical protein
MNEDFVEEVLSSLLDDSMGISANGLFHLKSYFEEVYQDNLPDFVNEIFKHVRVCEVRAFLYNYGVKK